ncbi:MAG: LysR family transcriptional regulator, partial [Pseudomonadota bacterium]
PVVLAKPYLTTSDISTFDPGWMPEPLSFTASYLAGGGAAIAHEAAVIAREVAHVYDQKI